MCAYPASITPNEGWNTKLKVGTISSFIENSFVGRRFPGKFEDCVEDDWGNYLLRESVFCNKDMPGLSTSLINIRFQYDCFSYRQIGKGELNWHGEKIITGNYQEGKDFEVISEYWVAGWNLDKIQGLTIPYNRSMNKKSEFESLKNKLAHLGGEDRKEISEICSTNFEDLPKDETTGIRYVKQIASVKINHNPVNLNYWHFTIDQYSMEEPEKELRNAKSAWKNLIADGLRDIMKRTFTKIISSHPAFGYDYQTIAADV